LKKTLSVVFTFIVCAGLLLSGCAATDKGTVAENGGSESKAGNTDGNKEQVTLTFWHRWPESQPVFDRAIKEFEEKYPHIKIDLPSIASQQYQAQIQAAISGNDLPDIFANHSSVPLDQLHQLDLIRELEDVFTERKKEEFYEGTWTDGYTTMDGKVYAIPHFTPRRFAHVMFYNKDVLENAGLTEQDVPKTWDELIAVGQKIRENSPDDVYPLILGVKTDWLMTGFIGQMATAISPEVIPNSGFNLKTGQYEFNSAGYVETIEFIKKLQDEKILHPNSLVINYREASSLFAGGKAAFVIDGTFLTSELKLNNKFENFGVAPLPTKDGKPQYYAFQGETKASVHVNKNTKHYEEVKLFLNFYMDRIYELQLQMGVEGSPIIEQNENTKVDDPQFLKAQQIQDETFILSPQPYTRNPAAIRVNTELNGRKPKETVGKILEGYLAGQFSDLKSMLTQYTDNYNKAMQESIAKVQSSGAAISQSDYQFPNWIPFTPYTKEKYDELK